MKSLIRTTSVVSMAIISTLALAALSEQAQAATAKPSWKVTGELEEACSCRAACPCWFKSLPTCMTCDGAQVIFITKGRYGKVPLDGLAIGQFVQSPEHKSMFESFGNWNFDYVYIDEKANDEQREALKEVAAHFFAPGAKKREFRYVSISRDIKGDEHATSIGKYGGFS